MPYGGDCAAVICWDKGILASLPEASQGLLFLGSSELAPSLLSKSGRTGCAFAARLPSAKICALEGLGEGDSICADNQDPSS